MSVKQRELFTAIRRRGPLLFLGILVGSIGPISCSLILQNPAEQCQSDDDCKEIAGTHCDLSTHICSTQDGTTTTTSTGGGGTGGTMTTSTGGGGTTTTTDCDAGGCWACEPTNDAQFLNACTDAKCEKFDNKARCKHLTEDGGVPPLDASFD